MEYLLMNGFEYLARGARPALFLYTGVVLIRWARGREITFEPATDLGVSLYLVVGYAYARHGTGRYGRRLALVDLSPNALYGRVLRGRVNPFVAARRPDVRAMRLPDPPTCFVGLLGI